MIVQGQREIRLTNIQFGYFFFVVQFIVYHETESVDVSSLDSLFNISRIARAGLMNTLV